MNTQQFVVIKIKPTYIGTDSAPVGKALVGTVIDIFKVAARSSQLTVCTNGFVSPEQPTLPLTLTAEGKVTTHDLVLCVKIDGLFTSQLDPKEITGAVAIAHQPVPAQFKPERVNTKETERVLRTVAKAFRQSLRKKKRTPRVRKRPKHFWMGPW